MNPSDSDPISTEEPLFLLHYRVKTSLSISGEIQNIHDPKQVIKFIFPNTEIQLLDWVEIKEYGFSFYGLNIFIKIYEDYEEIAKLKSLSFIDIILNVLSFVHKVPCYTPVLQSIILTTKEEKFDFKQFLTPKQFGDSQYYIQKINSEVVIAILSKLFESQEINKFNSLLSLIRFGKLFRNTYLLIYYLDSLKALYSLYIHLESKNESEITFDQYLLDIFTEEKVSEKSSKEIFNLSTHKFEEMNDNSIFSISQSNFAIIEKIITKQICVLLKISPEYINYILSPPLSSIYTVIIGKIDPINHSSDKFTLDYPIFELRKDVQFFKDEDLSHLDITSKFHVDPINLKNKIFSGVETQIWGEFFDENVTFKKIKYTHFSKNQLEIKLDCGKNHINKNPNSLIFRPYYKLIREGKPNGNICHIFFNNDKNDKFDINLFGSICYTKRGRIIFFPGFVATKITQFNSSDESTINQFEVDHFTLEPLLDSWHITHRNKDDKFVFSDTPKTYAISEDVIFWFSISIRCDIIIEKINKINIWEYEHFRSDIERHKKFLKESRRDCEDILIRPADNRIGETNYFWNFELYIVKHNREETIKGVPFNFNENIIKPIISDPQEIEIRTYYLRIPGSSHRIGINASIISGEMRNETIIRYL